MRVAYHAFWLDEEDTDAWYNAGTGVVRSAVPGTDVDPFVGSEIDITMKYPFFDNRLTAEVGYGHFFTGDYVDDTGRDTDADFVFIQSKLIFLKIVGFGSNISLNQRIKPRIIWFS